jgi:hypothetical protein
MNKTEHNEIKLSPTTGNACEHNPTRNIKYQHEVGNLNVSHCSSLDFCGQKTASSQSNFKSRCYCIPGGR